MSDVLPLPAEKLRFPLRAWVSFAGAVFSPAGEIVNEKIGEHDNQKNDRTPYRPSSEANAQKCRHDPSRDKRKDHENMHDEAPFRLGVAVRGSDDVYPHLTEMIGAEGGRHRNVLSCAKRVVLHRRDEIDRHLKYLHGRAVRDEPEDEQAQRLDCDKERLPACKSDRIHIFRKKFRKHRAEEIRRNRYEIVERAVKASLAELHRKQNEVCGLRVAEHSALQCEGIRAEKSADRDHHQIHAKLFRLGKFLFAQNYIIFSHFVHLHFCMFFVSILSFQAPFVKLIVRFSDKYAVCERRKFIFGFCSASGFEKAVNIFSFSS